MNMNFKDEFVSALDSVKAEQENLDNAKIYVLSNISKRKNHAFAYTKYALAACLLLILCLGGFGAHIYTTAPIAYVNIEINPSVELGVNRLDKVVWVHAYNSDGETVLESLNVIGCSAQDATELIVASAINNGFVSDDSFVSITASTDDYNVAVKLESEAELGAHKALDDRGLSADIYAEVITSEERAAAIAQGISPGKMNLIKKLITIYPSTDIEEYRDMSVKDLLGMIISSGRDNNIIIEEGITTSPSDVPDYGWVSTRLEQVRNIAFGENAYEITLHYKAWHNDPAVESLNDINITIELPNGVTPKLYGSTGLQYDSEASILTKHINTVSTTSNSNYKEIFTVVLEEPIGKNYTIISNVKIGDNPDDFTSYTVLNPAYFPGGNTSGGTAEGGSPNPDYENSFSLELEDSYIITTEDVRINKGSNQQMPYYTTFVDIDKKVGDFKIYTKISDDTYSNVSFTVLGNTYPAELNSEGYRTATISNLTGHGEAYIIINADGKRAQAGKLLLLFAE